MILLVGPPGTGKTSIRGGLASRTAASLSGLGEFAFLEVEPHALASSSLGKSQKAVDELAGRLLAGGLIPTKAAQDAFHVAVPRCMRWISSSHGTARTSTM